MEKLIKALRLVITLAVLLALTAYGAGGGEVNLESYGNHGSPMLDSFRCYGFGRDCTVMWNIGEGFGHREVAFSLYRAPLGSRDYESIDLYFLTGEQGEENREYSFNDSGLELSDENQMRIYKYRLDVFAGGEMQSFGPIVYRSGCHAAEPTNSFLGVAPSNISGPTEIAIISDREQTITCSVNRLGSEDREIVFERDIGPGYYVFRWDGDLTPGEYEMRIPMIGWNDELFENKCGFIVE